MKKNILVYWDYRRTDLLLPFIKLANDFDFIFVFFRDKNQDLGTINFRHIYWGDYHTPYQLLNSIKPNSVIFSDLSSLYAISLNIASKNKKLPTFLLDHGIKLDFDYYLKIESSIKKLKNGSNGLGGLNTAAMGSSFRNKVHTLFFYISSLKRKNGVNIFKALKLFFYLYKYKSIQAFASNHFNLRCPEKYLLFSNQNFLYYNKLDGISIDKVIFIGNPYLDDILKLNREPVLTEDSYYLLLDDGQIESFGITTTQKINFLEKLNQFSLSQGNRLVIKLHPFDFGRKDLFPHENIQYLENVDVAKIIKYAKGIFAISTTLMLPLLVSSRLILFRVSNSKIQEVVFKYGVQFLDFLDFTPDQIEFNNHSFKKDKEPEFIEQFLFKKDGLSTLRLKNILRSTE